MSSPRRAITSFNFSNLVLSEFDIFMNPLTSESRSRHGGALNADRSGGSLTTRYGRAVNLPLVKSLSCLMRSFLGMWSMVIGGTGRSFSSGLAVGGGGGPVRPNGSTCSSDRCIFRLDLKGGRFFDREIVELV
ncbi:hypothetical protein NPIL_146461 [Nephila pilipes]|uniref:Uncharacterized protein n=1 Tax=Nephila pilipes TaxID=299642 RepID=A0A8X6NZQ4_NEPPI|nr:hypothetical protein NPIL_146461 [Nephila pilipes]